MEYSVGTTCFGSFPGVLSKLNGFSAVTVAGKIMESSQMEQGSTRRIFAINAGPQFAQGGSAAPRATLK
jgi:hypothetical protein